jgi:protein-S-isoprenylcysteine O-methyltransferase Ste14
MESYLGALTVLLLLGMVLTRVQLLKRSGITAFKFGELDKTDFLIPPFALFYFYLIFANAFGWPTVSGGQLFVASWVSWIGVFSCSIGLCLLLLSLVSFGTSFRIGIDTDRPDKLVTSGLFALTRNPIYVAFGFVLLGEFLIFSNGIMLIYLIAGIGLFHRQVLLEESYLSRHYGPEYRAYCARVRRYL